MSRRAHWAIRIAAIAFALPIIGLTIETHAPATGAQVTSSGPVRIVGIDDPDARDLGFRAVQTCDRRTGMGTLCHYLVRHEGGKAKKVIGLECVPIGCAVAGGEE